MNGSVSVIIAAPHDAFRAGLRASLGFDFSIVGEAESVDELKRITATTHADLVLLDEALPGGGVRKAVAVAPPSAKVVVFADKARDDRVVEALRLGASGYLLKNVRPERIGTTLRAVMNGELALARTLVAALVDEIVRAGKTDSVIMQDGRRFTLTPRERQVASLIEQGCSTTEIAAGLGISAVTARRHISELMRKLSVETRAEAVAVLTG
jgi:DNA-binding NarL/FixJ family response regulator